MTFLEKVKIKLQNFSKSRQLLLLDVLDFLVDKGNMNIWSSISSKKFFQGLLDLLRTKDIPEVQMKLLGLIQKWGLNFEDKKNSLPNFFSVYNKLRMNNVQFPSNFESNYQVYLDSGEDFNNNKNNYEKNSDNEKEESDKEDNEIFYYMDSLKEVLKVPNFEHKYRRLVNFLVKMHDNIQMANLLIDNREHGGLKEIINTLREGNNTLIDTIQGGRLKDEKLMEITLGTTEDINQTLGRDEDIKNGYKPNKFKSYFVINNVIRIKNNNHRNRAKSTKPKKNVQKYQDNYRTENYDKNKYKEKMGKPKNVDDIFDLFSASNPNNEPQYFQNNNNRGGNNNMNNINFFNSSQTQQLRNNPMNNFFNNNNRGNNNMNNMNNMNNNNRNNNPMFFNHNNIQYNQPRPVMTNFDILEQKLNNLNIEQNNNNNYMNNNPNVPNNQFNQGYNNNNNQNNNGNNNLMNMLDKLGPGPQNNSEQLVPYIGTFNNQNNNNMNQNNNNFMNNNNNNQYNNNFGNNMNNNNNQFNNNRNMFNSVNLNRENNNMQINNNDNQMGMNRINMSQNFGNNNNNWMNQNNNNNNNQNNQQMSYEEMQKQQRLKELDDLF